MMELYCCACGKEKPVRLTDGEEIYPHRADLHHKNFYKCDDCGNYVGCHNGTETALGCLPTPELRAKRSRIHAVLDPLWRNTTKRNKTRSELYREISDRIGKQFHTGEIQTEEEADNIFSIVLEIKGRFGV